MIIYLPSVPLMLEESFTYLEERARKDHSFTYEMIIVDDGSKDKTTEVAMGYSKKFGCDKVRVLTLAWNRGKGGAVRMVNMVVLKLAVT